MAVAAMEEEEAAAAARMVAVVAPTSVGEEAALRPEGEVKGRAEALPSHQSLAASAAADPGYCSQGRQSRDGRRHESGRDRSSLEARGRSCGSD